MSYQTNLKSSGFRDLNPQELDAVSGGIVVTAPRPSSGNIWSGSGDGAGGLSSGFNGFLFMDLSLLAGLGAVDWEAFKESLANIDWTLPPEDLDGDGEPGITVTGDRGGAPDGFTLGPVNPSTGLIHIMYLNGPDGRPDFSQPPVLTPEGERFACDAYDEAQEGISDAGFQLGVGGFLTGRMSNPTSWIVSGIGAVSLGLQSQVDQPSHCQ